MTVSSACNDTMRQTDFQQETASSFKMSNADFDEVRSLTQRLAGIHLNEGKRELVSARLSKRIRILGMKSMGEYLGYVREQKTQEELISLLDALTTNLTSFWRESKHFDYLAGSFLPRWVGNTQQLRERRLRIWSAGCSTGEEPYSAAMLLLSELEQCRIDIKVLATDLSTKVLETAKAGLYDAERIKQVPDEIRTSCFIPEKINGKTRYRVHPRIREIVSFSRLNLTGPWPMKGPFDCIFCRNVMIYFDKTTQQTLISRFFEILRPGGVLFVGHSESLAGISHKYQYLQPTIYEKP
jgi:chemotaxis protein methyltransferase CheR